MSLTAGIFSISGGSVHDGPGVRTTVYFKGCNLSCTWCHNPEGQRAAPEISFVSQKCIGCGECVKICPEHHRVTDGVLTFFPDGCATCGKCADACYAHALTLNGRKMTADEVMERILRDKHFYDSTGGGVTFSGGECLLQHEFLRELLLRCRAEGIHTLIESAFCIPPETIEPLLSLTDAFYVDLKLFDGEQHREYTGRDNRLILENIARFAPVHPDFTVRVPLIPTVNDSPENLLATARFAQTAGAKAVELLRYNPLGAAKYAQLGRTAAVYGEPQTPEQMKRLCGLLNEKIGTEFVYFTE